MSERKGGLKKDTVLIDSDKLLDAIKKSGITMTKLSTMVLGRGSTYISESLRDSRCSLADLKKLCDFLDLNCGEIIKSPETPAVADEQKAPAPTINLDALILGINNLYQIEKDNAELMKQLVEQVRATNVKLGRFENLLGQMHASTLGIKENTKDIESLCRDTKSSVAGIAGRVRDIAQKK